MSELVAKSIVKNQFWIVTDGDKKVGNIEANNDGYSVQLNGQLRQFNSSDEIKKSTHIKFENIDFTEAKITKPYPEYPTPAKVYNSVIDITRGLHLFTETAQSKCLHAAGWFVVEHNGIIEVIFCPKYIFVQRYPYKGPFKTETDANLRVNN